MAGPAQIDQLLRSMEQPWIELQCAQIFRDRFVPTALKLQKMPQLDVGVGVVANELERSAVSGFCVWRPPAFPECIALLHPGRCTSRVSL